VDVEDRHLREVADPRLLRQWERLAALRQSIAA
jgi:hypothetical protein